jgi:hypothetical protein
MFGDFRLHDQFRTEVVCIGAERTPVLVIDNFLKDAEALVEFAARAAFSPVDQTIYPGLRVPIPMEYPFAVLKLLRDALRETFSVSSAQAIGGQADFSLITTRPGDAHYRQRYPHFDGPDPNIIAGLHYLCSSEQGGTSFYRHRSTSFESVNVSRYDAYVRVIEEEIAAQQKPPIRYTNGDTPLFERVASFDAVFNRMLIYRGITLHSPNIASDFRFDANPKTGRLTANAFFLFRTARAPARPR